MLWAFFLESVGAGYEIDYSLPSSAYVKNVWNYILASSHVTVFCLISAKINVIIPSSKLEVSCEVAGFIKQSTTLAF